MTSNVVFKKAQDKKFTPFLVRFARKNLLKIVLDKNGRQVPETIITAVDRETTDDN